MVEMAEVVAALQAVLDNIPCDECYEDDTLESSFDCTCRCHRREYEARQAARRLLTRIKADEQQSLIYRERESGGNG